MKKLDIHRDMTEPSLEDMQKHMNFEEVLTRASSTPVAPKKGWNSNWIIGGAAAVTAIVASVFFVSQNNIMDARYEHMSMEGVSIEKITDIEPQQADVVFAAVTGETQSEESNPTEEVSYDDFYPTPEPIVVELYKPMPVSTIPFNFDESFGLKEQWQAFPELSIYENLVFQPIGKDQQSMLKVTWEKASFHQDDNGQYYLVLEKNGQDAICPVTPVFEKEDYLNALDTYQEHQP